MSEFFLKTMDPGIFWTALSALATLIAVVVALLLPFLIPMLRLNRVERLIRSEIDRNTAVIRNMRSREVRKLPDGHEISPMQNNDALVPHIDLRLWHQYRYELASERPGSYEKFHLVNRYAEAIIDAADKEPAAMRMMIQTSEAESFIDSYHKMFS